MFRYSAVPKTNVWRVGMSNVACSYPDTSFLLSRMQERPVYRSLSLGDLVLSHDDVIDQKKPTVQSIVEAYFSLDMTLAATRLFEKIKNKNRASVEDALRVFVANVRVSEDPRMVAVLDKIKLKLVAVVGFVLPELRQEALPFRIKARLTSANVVSFFLKAASQIFDETTFTGVNKLVAQYNVHVLEIKKHLFNTEDSQAIGWKPRNSFLFVWCRILIEETGHPALEALTLAPAQMLENRWISGYQMRAEDLRRTSYDIFSKFVLPLTCADDIADTLQDKSLLTFFTDVFNVDSYSAFKHINADAKAVMMVPKSKYAAYRPFFKFYITTFQSAMNELETLVGEPCMQAAWGEIRESWQIVMTCLHQSIDINQELISTRHAAIPMNVKADEMMLAQNMLMSFFKKLEKHIISAYTIPDPVLSNLQRDTVFEKAEILGHAANHWATLVREIEEGDYSNTLLILLDQQISAALLAEDRTFSKYCNAHFKDHKGLPPSVTSFRALLSHLKGLDAQIVSHGAKILSAISYDSNALLACASSKDLCKFVDQQCAFVDVAVDEEAFFSSSDDAFLTLKTELRGFSIEKQALSQLVLNLAKKLRVFESYGERIDSIFDQMVEAADPTFSDYISGVENLVALYLACKREI